MVLLDADVLVDVFRNRPQAIHWLTELGGVIVTTPGYAALELYAGCRNAREQVHANNMLSIMQVIWASPSHCDSALANFKRYSLSHGLGILDALIGKTAIEFGVPLHMFNVKHFSPIPGLTTIQPYIR